MHKLRLSSPMQAMLMYGLGLGVMKGMSLIMLPWLTNLLPQAEFGRLELILSIAVFASVVAGLGLQEAMCRFIGEAASDNHKHQVASEFFGLSLVASSFTLPLLLGAALAISNWFPHLFSFYELSLVLSLLAFESCINLPLTWMRMKNRPGLFFLATTGRALFNAVLIIVLVRMGRGVTGVLEAGFISAVVQLLLLSHYQYLSTGVALSRRLVKPMFVYALPLVATGLMGFALNGLDRWILQTYTDSETLALYAVGAKFALGLVLLQQPFTLWWFPRRYDVLFNQGPDKAARTTTLGIACLSLVAITLSLAVPVFIHLLLPNEYQMAASIAGLLLLAALLKEAGELLNLGCMSKHSSEVQLYINLGMAIVGVGLMLILAGTSGIWGVALGLTAAQMGRLLLLYIAGQRMAAIPYSPTLIFLLLGTAASVLILAMLELSWAQRVLAFFVGYAVIGIGLLTSGLVRLPCKWRAAV
ncbi:lipopolysaccharide biosynthesis protein [Shewanella corallii]|uniref:Lipopolysaccharide biosynthesis protein n=1 Tax=Shewanella corallii TaxID=560080 RepID=A0ABT0N6F5_9GAMM|nr:lipopolysaccharide biosynthesis protein [Shewanella corallii]MCL2914038.1 lipopolysaccharide biosynthesis protein [Shewanella corallii]